MPTNPGRIGAWLGGLAWATAGAEREAVAEIEELGYGAVWFPEFHVAKEPISHAGLLLAASRRIVVATGIASIWVRDAMSMSSAAKTLAEAYPGRFLLGIGVSHSFVVETRGQRYERPVSRMREYLEAMDGARYDAPEPAAPVTRVLAALRPPMLELARDLADGAHPYFVPVEHTARAREVLGSGKLLATEQAIVLETDPAEARAAARQYMRLYLAAPNYVANLRWLGWDPSDIENGGSDALVDAIVAWGDEDAIRARVQAHLDAGADHVCIQPLAARANPFGFDPSLGLDQLRALAPALLP